MERSCLSIPLNRHDPLLNWHDGLSHCGERLQEILLITGAKEKRRRKLEARVMVALVIAMALYRDLCIPAVFLEMTSWQWESGTLGDTPLKLVTDRALGKSRRRLGVDTLA